jgi:hypothetical protein
LKSRHRNQSKFCLLLAKQNQKTTFTNNINCCSKSTITLLNQTIYFMKKKLYAITAFIALFAYQPYGYSQTGATCGDAITVTPNDYYDYIEHTTADTVYWFEFTASSPYVNISLETPKYGLDVPHIHSLKLFSGNCSGLNLMAEDDLPHYSEAKYLNIDLNASNLQVGQTYYVRVDRKVPTHSPTCSRGGCTSNNSTDPSTFSIAIKRVFLVIPPDMLVEPPTSGWAMEVNRGQLLNTNGEVAEEVKIYNDHSNPGVFICDDHISYVFVGEQSAEKSYQRVDMTFLNSNSGYDVFKTEQVAGFNNYYMPHIPEGITQNKAYSRAVINKLYDNIDYHQYSNKNGLKNYFIVYPGGRTDNIQMKFDGADSVTIDTLNNLRIFSTLGKLQYEKPHVYTIDSTGFPQAIICNTSYTLIDNFTVGFNIVGYSGTEPLIIVMDQGHSAAAPKNIDNLLWSTYYGNTEDDQFNDIDHDDLGNVYFTGWTWDLQFPHTTQTIVTPTSHNGRILVGSHKPLGERRWCTIYGAEADLAFGCATDQLGNVYVTGVTGVYSHPNQFIDLTRAGAYNLAPLNTAANATYATLYRFNQSNGACSWATLFGEHTSTAWFEGKCIATDNTGNVYIGGIGKHISNSPLVHSGSQHFESTTGTKVGFLAKFSVAGALTWSTMFGNDNLVVNEMNTVFNPQTNENELFIVGTTTGTNANLFSLASVEQVNDYQVGYQGGSTDAFFAKFNSSDNLRWSSFFGGAGDDVGYGIDYNPTTTSLFLTGSTKSSSASFPLQTLSNPQIHFNGTLNGASDGYLSVLKFIPETTGGHTLYYSSYYGGSSDDQCGNVEISESGNVYVIGMTKSQNFPLQNLSGNYYQSVLENDPTGIHYDSFILGLNEYLAYGWGTYFGGEWYYNGSNVNAQSTDAGNGITIFNDEILYIGGSTNSDVDFPITVDLTASPNAYIQYENSGSSVGTPLGWSDGFLAQFDMTDVVLGLDDLNADETNGSLTVYPNPSNGNFSIVGSNLKMDGKINIEVVNVIGQRIYSKQSIVANGEITESITLGNLSNGIYIVNIGDGTHRISRRVVIQ